MSLLKRLVVLVLFLHYLCVVCSVYKVNLSIRSIRHLSYLKLPFVSIISSLSYDRGGLFLLNPNDVTFRSLLLLLLYLLLSVANWNRILHPLLFKIWIFE